MNIIYLRDREIEMIVGGVLASLTMLEANGFRFDFAFVRYNYTAAVKYKHSNNRRLIRLLAEGRRYLQRSEA